MEFWQPELVLPDGKPAQSQLIPKVGGLPWGFPQADWPCCGACDKPMHLICQLPGTTPGIGIERDETLHLFRCCWSLECDVALKSDALDDGKATIVLKTDTLGQGQTKPPVSPALAAKMSRLSHYVESHGQRLRESAVLPELWIQAFVQADDDVPAMLAPCFMDREAFDLLPRHHATPHDFDESQHTKFGGLPYWCGNGVMSEALAGATFLFQIGSFLTLAEEVPKKYLTFDQGGGDAALLEVADAIDGGTYGIFHDFCYNAPLMLFRLNDGRYLQVLAQ